MYAPRMEASPRSAPAVAVALVLGIAVVGLVLLASSSGTVRPATEATLSVARPDSPTPTASPSVGATTSTAPKSGAEPKPAAAPGWLKAVLQAAAYGIGALALLALLYPLRAALRLLRDVELPHAEPDRTHWEKVQVDHLAAAVDAGLAAVESGTADDGVIACWVALEDAAAAAGAPRAPSETPAEFTVRVLGVADGGVSRAELTRLAELYREARFSTHGSGEEARTEARTALVRVRSDLFSATGAR